MRSIFISLFLVFFLQGNSQSKTYKSLATEYLSTQQSEWIERDIIITDSLITIRTLSDSLTDLQRFLVNDISRENYKNTGLCTFYRCTSSDGKALSLFIIPVKAKVEIIEVLVPDQPGKKPKHYRFHID